MSAPKLAKEIEVSTYVCGYCGIGQHSKSKAKWRCKHIFYVSTPRVIEIECMCSCNDTERGFREMLRAAGQLPQQVNTSPYPALPVSTLQELSHDTHAAPEGHPDTDPDNTPTTVNLLRGGRMERGGLEQLVWEVVLDGLTKKVPVIDRDGITVKWIAFEILGRTRAAYPAGAGAIHSVLDRWSKLVLVTLEGRPAHVVGMNEQFMQTGPTKFRQQIEDAGRRATRGH